MGLSIGVKNGPEELGSSGGIRLTIQSKYSLYNLLLHKGHKPDLVLIAKVVIDINKTTQSTRDGKVRNSSSL